MLYHYYMKINLLRCFLFVFLFFPYAAAAQMMVVRVQDNLIYLDTSSSTRTVRKGDAFKLIVSTEKLTNPKTGKDLGNLYHYSKEGKITEVQPLYAVGTLPDGVEAQIGQEAVVEEPATPAVVPTRVPAATATTNDGKNTLNKLVYEPVDQTIISLSEGAVLQEHAQHLVTLSKEGQVTVWARANETLREMASYPLEKNRIPLAVSAVPLSTPLYADIFVSYFDIRQNQIFTLILHEQDGQLKEVGTLPYYVKERGCGPSKTLWAQRAFINKTTPGSAHPVVYTNEKFSVSDDIRPIQNNWLPSSLWFPAGDGKTEYFAYTASNGKIVLLLPNGKRAESKDLFATSPNRVKYKQEIVKFYPSLQVLNTAEQAVIIGVENTSKLGLLSSTFGQYQSGKVHFLSYEKGRLNITNSVDFDGVIYDTACTHGAILAAEVLPNGTSSVVEIFN